MNKIRISKRYNGMFKVSIAKFTANSVWEECSCHTGNNLLFRTDYTARLVGKSLLGDVNNHVSTHTIYISKDQIIKCSEETAVLIVSFWIEQGLFMDAISVNQPCKKSKVSYMNRIYRGAI